MSAGTRFVHYFRCPQCKAQLRVFDETVQCCDSFYMNAGKHVAGYRFVNYGVVNGTPYYNFE